MTTPKTNATSSPWVDASLAAALLALDPFAIGGIVVRAAAGPVRDGWLELVRSLLPKDFPIRRLPINATTDRILGSLDLAATLSTGRRVLDKGLLACVDNGCLIMPMAERLRIDTAAHIAAALDTGCILIERDGLQARMPSKFAVIAFDEGTQGEECPPLALLDRLALHVDLRECGVADIVDPVPDLGTQSACRDINAIRVVDQRIIKALCGVAMTLGIVSLRVPLLAVSVARLHARLCGRDAVSEADAAIAARLVLAPRATIQPSQTSNLDTLGEPQGKQSEPTDGPRDPKSDADTMPVSQLDDRIVAAAMAALPEHILQGLSAGTAAVSRSSSDGKAGVVLRSARRGRAVGVQPAARDRTARLNVLATLRSAAPWQRLRLADARASGFGSHRTSVVRLRIRREDFRVNAYKRRSGSTVIFAVDASGSSALHRLAEAKGAVEFLLAECYARRDNVALVSFRGAGAEVLLTPSRSLARAKRSLAGLPGGGGTPLVAGIEAARTLADRARRKGDTPLIVFMTDGRANVTRTGQGGRAEAEAQAIAAARDLSAAGIGSLLIDTSPQPHPFAAVIAKELGARYIPLPHADAGSISKAIEKERRTSMS